MLLFLRKCRWTFKVAVLLILCPETQGDSEAIGFTYYPPHGDFNGSMSLRCTMTIPVMKDDVMALHKAGVEGPLMEFALERGKCHVTKQPPPGYSCYCDFSYQYAHYEFEIHHARVVDRGVYWCTLARTFRDGVRRTVHSENRTVAVYDAKLVLVGTPATAVLDKPYTFECKITEAPCLVGSVEIRRGWRVFGNYYQTFERCKISMKPIEGYHPTCGPTGSEPLALAKTFILKIEKLSRKDAATWKCELDGIHKSNFIHLNIGYALTKEVHVVTRTNRTIPLVVSAIILVVTIAAAAYCYTRYKKSKGLLLGNSTEDVL